MTTSGATSGFILTKDDIRPVSEPALSGALHGYGVFETLRAYDTRLFEFASHMSRMRMGAAALGLGGLPSDADIDNGCARALAAGGLRDARVRITCVASTGGPRLWTDRDPLPAIVILQIGSVEPHLGKLRETGCPAITSSHQITERSIVSGIKTVGYAGHILAKRQAAEAAAWEAIILNCDGDIVEGSMSNVFVVWDDEIYTPPLDAGPLAGVTRQVVLDLARSQGTACNEVRFKLDAMRVADECFLTSSVAEIVPVTVLDGRPVGDGTVGEMTCRLQYAYARLTQALR